MAWSATFILLVHSSCNNGLKIINAVFILVFMLLQCMVEAGVVSKSQYFQEYFVSSTKPFETSIALLFLYKKKSVLISLHVCWTNNSKNKTSVLFSLNRDTHLAFPNYVCLHRKKSSRCTACIAKTSQSQRHSGRRWGIRTLSSSSASRNWATSCP